MSLKKIVLSGIIGGLISVASQAQDFSPALPTHPANPAYIQSENSGIEVTNKPLIYSLMALFGIASTGIIVYENIRSKREYNKFHKEVSENNH